jgi:hypothetical protein
MNDFLPPDYKAPVESKYMSFEKDKPNKFRFLTKPIFGMEYWKGEGENRTPVRKRMGQPIPVSELGIDRFGNPERARHFWAMAVYNYSTKQIEVLQITQKTLINSITDLAKNEDWGDPRNYDIVVTKSGDGLETKYSLMPSPAKPLPKEVEEEFKAMTVDLDALFDNGDPFGIKEPVVENNQDVNVDDLPF